MSIARLIESKTHILPGKFRVSELYFEVPKDYAIPSAGTIRIFARSVTKHDTPTAPIDDDELRKKAQKPWFVFLQGGPGFGCNSPQDFPMTTPILNRGYQMLCLDQRGTGQSTTVTADTLALQGGPQEQANYLKLFRADNIVRDCEAIRGALTYEYPPELKKWTIFGQSFGGFIAFTYLSKSPEGLREVFMTGGIPPVGHSADDVYKATFTGVMKRNQQYYEKYPEDVETVHRLALHMRSKGGVRLPSGGTLTVRRFLTLGLHWGFHGGLDTIHNVIFRMKSDLSQFGFITRPTLSIIDSLTSFDNNIIYAVLHESIYCQRQASNWAADRVGKMIKEFHWLYETPTNETTVREHPLYFTGEMIFPFMFSTNPELEKIRPAAEIIANFEDWPTLYDEWQLAKNEVPVYAATYVNDLYVNFDLTQETARKTKNMKQFITNEMYHNAYLSKTDEVLKALFALRDDTID